MMEAWKHPHQPDTLLTTEPTASYSFKLNQTSVPTYALSYQPEYGGAIRFQTLLDSFKHPLTLTARLPTQS